MSPRDYKETRLLRQVDLSPRDYKVDRYDPNNQPRKVTVRLPLVPGSPLTIQDAPLGNTAEFPAKTCDIYSAGVPIIVSMFRGFATFTVEDIEEVTLETMDGSFKPGNLGPLKEGIGVAKLFYLSIHFITADGHTAGVTLNSPSDSQVKTAMSFVKGLVL